MDNALDKAIEVILVATEEVAGEVADTACTVEQKANALSRLSEAALRCATARAAVHNKG